MTTRFKGSDREVRALDAYIKLTRASETLAAMLARPLARDGLTTAQLGVLEALLHLGAMNERELGRKLLRSGGHITTVLDNLERRGLIRRARGAEDRRCVFVSLTPKGKNLIGRVFPAHAGRIADAMGALDAAEQDELGRLCRKLGRAARESA
ncbi:MarR family transcriptional regulator [bacterium]|nr:MarR family transcriptional regulator [bacterium]